jgi:hypothetical protein
MPIMLGLRGMIVIGNTITLSVIGIAEAESISQFIQILVDLFIKVMSQPAHTSVSCEKKCSEKSYCVANI